MRRGAGGDLEFGSSPSPSQASEASEAELVPSTPIRGGDGMLYNGGASSSSVSHGLGRAADGGSILASPETPARPRAPPPPQAADEDPVAPIGVAVDDPPHGVLFMDWAAASPLDDTQALDASSSGEGGREVDLTVDISEEGSAVAEYQIEDPLSQGTVESPEKDPCRRGCCALLPGRVCEAHLVLLSSCRPTMDVPHVVHLGKERCTIGRAVESDVYLDSVAYPRTLSREHAVIERRGPCNFIVKDLRSVNGVYVNGKAIKDEQELVPGDVILFGRKTARPEFGYVFEVEDFREYRRLHAGGQKRSRESGGSSSLPRRRKGGVGSTGVLGSALFRSLIMPSRKNVSTLVVRGSRDKAKYQNSEDVMQPDVVCSAKATLPIFGVVMLLASMVPVGAFHLLGFGLPVIVAYALCSAGVYYASTRFITMLVEEQGVDREVKSLRVEELEAETKALRREVVEARKAAEVAKCEVANSEEALLKMDGVGQAYEELKVLHGEVMEEVAVLKAEEGRQGNDENQKNCGNMVKGDGLEEELARLREAIEIEKARRVEADQRVVEVERARQVGEDLARQDGEDRDSDLEVLALEGERLRAKLDHYRCLNAELEEVVDQVRWEKAAVEEEMAELRGAVEKCGGPAGVVEKLREAERVEETMKREMDGIREAAEETENSLLVEVELIRSVAETAESEVKRLKSFGEELKERNVELEGRVAELEAELKAFAVPGGILKDLGIVEEGITPEAFYDVLEGKVAEWRCMESTLVCREKELEEKEEELEEKVMEVNKERREVIRLRSILAELEMEKESEVEELREEVEALVEVQERFEGLRKDRDEAEVGAWCEVTRVKGEMETLEGEYRRVREEGEALKVALGAAERELAKAGERVAGLAAEVDNMKKYRVQRELLEGEVVRLRDRLEVEVDRADCAVRDLVTLSEKEAEEREEMEEMRDLVERLQEDLESATDAVERGEVRLTEKNELLRIATEEKTAAEVACGGLKEELEKERTAFAEREESFRDELSQAEKKAEEARERERALREELEGVRGKEERLRGEKERLEEMVAEKEARFSGELVMIKVELRELKAVVEEKEKELVENRQTITTLEDLRCQLKGDLRDAKGQCQKATAKTKELEEATRRMMAECEDLKGKLEGTRKAAAVAEREMSEKLRDAERKVQEAAERAREVEGRYEALEGERGGVVARLKTVEEAMEEKERTVEELEGKLAEQTCARGELERELSDREERLKEKVEEVEGLKRKLREQSSARERREEEFKRRLDVIEGRCEELGRAVESTGRELREADEALEGTRRQLMSKENELVREAWQRQMYEREVAGLKEALGEVERKLVMEREEKGEVKARLGRVEGDWEAARGELEEAVEERGRMAQLLGKAEVEVERLAFELSECKEELRGARIELATTKEEMERLVRETTELRKTLEEAEEAVERLKELVKAVEEEREREKDGRLNAEELASELSDERVRLESELTFIRMEQQRLEDRMTEYKAQVEEVEKRSIEKDNLITDLKHELTATSTTGRETVTVLESTRSELMATTAMLGATRRALTVARKENDGLRGTTKSGG